MARTDTLPNFLTDIADAIREKKGTEETIQASDFDTEIASISSGADISEYFNTTISSYNGIPPYFQTIVQKKIPQITVADNITTLSIAFYDCKAEEIEGVAFNNNITDMSSMFSGASNLKSVGLNNVDTSNVTNFNALFMYCSSLTSLDLSKFVTTSANTMQQMFSGCSSLTSLDLSNFYTPQLENCRTMFANCTSLAHIDIRNMTFDNVTESTNMFGASLYGGVPDNCEIIVKSQTEKEWITSKFSRLTNVKTVAEYEAE